MKAENKKMANPNTHATGIAKFGFIEVTMLTNLF
jgi:hypothetical protein